LKGSIKRREKGTNLRSLVFAMLFVAVSFSRSFEGMRGLNVTDVRRERIPLLRNTVGKRAVAKGFSF